MFALLADVEIRERSGNRRSLDDGLRAIVEAGGDLSCSRPLARVLATADGALDRPVLGPLYERMGRRRLEVDLKGLWQRLGVSLQGERVVFDDGAPLAHVRRGITAAPVLD